LRAFEIIVFEAAADGSFARIGWSDEARFDEIRRRRRKHILLGIQHLAAAVLVLLLLVVLKRKCHTLFIRISRSDDETRAWKLLVPWASNVAS